MRTIRANRSEGIWRKICVACGYDGTEVRGDLGEIGYQCPHCGQDLYARSPMSYAEMEGFGPGALLEGLSEEVSIIEGDPIARHTSRWWARVAHAVGTFFKVARTERDA